MDHSEFQHEAVKLGKQPHKADPRTLRLADYFKLPDIHLPESFDFDANRRPIPESMWGNDQYGNCVIAAESNELLRLERVETWQTVPLTDLDPIKRYKSLTGCEEPGDENDSGLVMLDSFRDWRNNGYLIAYKDRVYKIDAYGELDYDVPEEIRFAIYLLHGVHFGISLPIAAQGMTNNGVWDYKGQTGANWERGSWGGHAVYSKRYNEHGVFVMTWDMEIFMTNAFISQYVDEAWGVVDSFDTWRKTGHLDVSAMQERLRQITSQVNK